MSDGDDYAQLFNVRGGKYHVAMTRYPAARDDEFRSVLQAAGVRPGQTVADIPCGGGYLAGHLPADTTLWSVDSSDVFADCFRRTQGERFLLCPLTAVPLADATCDHIVSVAGLHHIADRRPFWQECARLLRAGGTLTVADVRAGSRVAHFLDDTVDRHTETGHRGDYFDTRTVDEMRLYGLHADLAETRRIAWRAADRLELADFCRLLFGLRDIDNATLADVLARDVGVRTTADGVELDWELMIFRARKTAS